jgi:predicted nucleic acid-binding protein
MAQRADAVAPPIAVLDASVVVDLLVRGEPALPRGYVFVAPAHLDAEVLSALARLCRAETLSAKAVKEMLVGLSELAVQRMPLPTLLTEAFELRDNVTQRDSLYIALARLVDATFVTRDDRLALACRQRKLCTVLTWNGTWI